MDVLTSRWPLLEVVQGATAVNPSLVSRFAVVLLLRLPVEVRHDEVDRVLAPHGECLGSTIPCIHGSHVSL